MSILINSFLQFDEEQQKNKLKDNNTKIELFKEIEPENGNSILHISVWNENYNWCVWWIENKFNINATNHYSQTPLHWAVNVKNNRIINYLLEEKANPNLQDMNGETPMHVAVYNNEYKVIKLLVLYKANSEWLNKNKMKPIDIAKEIGYTKCFNVWASLNIDNNCNNNNNDQGNILGYSMANKNGFNYWNYSKIKNIGHRINRTAYVTPFYANDNNDNDNSNMWSVNKGNVSTDISNANTNLTSINIIHDDQNNKGWIYENKEYTKPCCSDNKGRRLYVKKIVNQNRSFTSIKVNKNKNKNEMNNNKTSISINARKKLSQSPSKQNCQLLSVLYKRNTDRSTSIYIPSPKSNNYFDTENIIKVYHSINNGINLKKCTSSQQIHKKVFRHLNTYHEKPWKELNWLSEPDTPINPTISKQNQIQNKNQILKDNEEIIDDENEEVFVNNSRDDQNNSVDSLHIVEPAEGAFDSTQSNISYEAPTPKQIETIKKKKNDENVSKINWFFKEINLEEYTQNFINEGFDDIDLITSQMKTGFGLTSNNLKELGVIKLGDRAKILIRLQELTKYYSFSLPDENIYYKNKHLIFKEVKYDFKIKELLKWLRNLNLGEYIQNFYDNGYHCIEWLYVQYISKINPLTDKTLEDIGIDKIGYRTRILNKIKEDSQLYIDNLKSKSNNGLLRKQTTLKDKKDKPCIII